MLVMADGLARLIAPILPMTADELWGCLPGRRDDSVHLADFPSDLEALADAALAARWQRLMALRDAVNVEIERLRQAKVVGKSEEAKVELRATGEPGRAARPPPERPADDLHDVGGRASAGRPIAGQGAVYTESDDSWATIVVSRADGVRCDRCWRYVPAVSRRSGPPGPLPAVRAGAGGGAGVKRLSAASLGLAGAIVVVDQLTQGGRAGLHAAARQPDRSSPACWTSRTCRTPARRSGS